jgi:hypothetical protein
VQELRWKDKYQSLLSDIVVKVLAIHGSGTSIYGVRHSSFPVKLLGLYKFHVY